jgi:hypothetical protein
MIRLFRMAALLCCLSMTSCNTRELVSHDLMLSIFDLPAGWNHDKGVENPKVPGANARIDQFLYSPHQDWLVISHEVAIYQSADAAKVAYVEWEGTWFPVVGGWRRPDEATFVPSDSRDLYRLGCIDFRTYRSCGLLQQHGRLLSLALVNVDPPAITLEQFEAAMTRVDQRFQGFDVLATSVP